MHVTAIAADQSKTGITVAWDPGARRGRLTVAGDRVTCGLGDGTAIDRAALHELTAKVVGRLRELDAGEAVFELPAGVDPQLAATAITEACVLGDYRLGRFKREPEDEDRKLASVAIRAADEGVVARAVTLSTHVNRARELQDAPPNVLTPVTLAEHAHRIAAEHEHVTCETGGRERLAELGMGAFAAVAQGSANEPQLIVLRHEPPGARGPLLGLVGKGVTFDSGGLSIKPAKSMVTMKSDMSGAAAVIEATAAIAALGLPVRTVTVAGATENTIGPEAMRVGDVLTAADGTTIEVDNTDAEGRLVLADCLHHAAGLGAEQLIDVATLTGAMKVALGNEYCGYFATGDDLAAAFERAGAATGEPVWRMPLDERYGEAMKGTVADLTNAAIGKGGGACTAAAFLRHFTHGLPWIHVDFSTAFDIGLPYAKKGGSGGMVRTLVEYARALT